MLTACILACLAGCAQGTPLPTPISEIARGISWVSPYWGYNTPKIVFDGDTYYTVGLWGASPDAAHGVLYCLDGGKWREGASLPDIYQPPTLVLDRDKRLVVAYTLKEKPARFLRSRKPGSADAFDEIPPPPDMLNAYYIGIAVRDETLYLGYLAEPSYTMFLAMLNLSRLEWTPSIVMQEGQVKQKPKTAWTYPILFPTAEGLHVVATNCPDGSEGNTYNEVWYVFYPPGTAAPARREKVADCPVGHSAYAMDMLVDKTGAVHVIFMWNQRKYGEPLPSDSPEEGVYHAWRDPTTGQWHRARLGPISICGFHGGPDGPVAIITQPGAIRALEWRGAAEGWVELPPLCDPGSIISGPSFMDVLSSSSGSQVQAKPVLVFDGPFPIQEYESAGRVLQAFLPKQSSLQVR
jgi:hypothetical protein